MKKVFCLPSKASFILPVTVTQGKEIRVQTTTLVDSGAYAVFVHHRFVKEHGLKTNTLGKVIHVYNVSEMSILYSSPSLVPSRYFSLFLMHSSAQ